MSEFAYAVQPRSTANIVSEAESFLARVCPEHLTSGTALEIEPLVDFGLERERIAVCPVHESDLPTSEAETRAASAPGWIEIWMRAEFFDALFEINSSTVRARSTLTHEIGHAVLHRREVIAGRDHPQTLALRRARRRDLKAYEDSEWQAHAFAGALLIPVRGLALLEHSDPAAIADRFKVSEPFAQSHLKRVRRLR